MFSLAKFFGLVSNFDEQICAIANKLFENASAQSLEQKININEEADKIAAKCALTSNSPLLKKRNEPSHFTDVAFALFCYPPELACLIAYTINDRVKNLGFQPLDTIVFAIAKITTYYSGGMFARVSEVRQNDILTELLADKPIRARKAGEFLARAIIMAVNNLYEARKIYHKTPMDTEVKRILDNELIKVVGLDIANAIIKK